MLGGLDLWGAAKAVPRIIMAGPVTFLVLYLCLAIPSWLSVGSAESEAADTDFDSLMWLPLYFIAYIVAVPMLLFAALIAIRDERVTIRDAMSVGLVRIFNILLYNVLWCVMVGGLLSILFVIIVSGFLASGLELPEPTPTAIMGIFIPISALLTGVMSIGVAIIVDKDCGPMEATTAIFSILRSYFVPIYISGLLFALPMLLPYAEYFSEICSILSLLFFAKLYADIAPTQRQYHDTIMNRRGVLGATTAEPAEALIPEATQ